MLPIKTARGQGELLTLISDPPAFNLSKNAQREKWPVFTAFPLRYCQVVQGLL